MREELSTRFSRRVFLARASGLVLTLGGGFLPRFGAPRNPYAGGVWLAGDHHIHTRFSPDGQYDIAHQVALAARYGLGWCVITDHGGPHHDRIAVEQAYPELLAARRRFPKLRIYQGLEWNIPAAEHGSVILPMVEGEDKLISEFEALFDERNVSRPDTPANTEADAVAGVRYLQSLNHKPLFFANHPSRRGLDSPHEMRAWADAGPDVTRGFEGAPGHQAATLVGSHRGEYDKSAAAVSFPGYPPESYRTMGGYDWCVAVVGGLWDSLLGEGRPWYITANSDSHRHWTDRTIVDGSTYGTKGYVTPTERQVEKSDNPDFYPGEYAKTWVYAPSGDPNAILDAMRSGSMFTVLGDLIDRLELWATDGSRSARMGSDLVLDRRGADVEFRLRLRVPRRPNFGGRVPRLHHVDLIVGDILGPAANRDAVTNPTTRVLMQVPAADLKREGEYLTFRHRFRSVDKPFYVRLRGTNTDVPAPRVDPLDVDPWEDLWFYSNPVFIRVPR